MDKEQRALLVKAIREESFEEKGLLPKRGGQRSIMRGAAQSALEDRRIASRQRATLADVPLHRRRDGNFRSGADQARELNRSISSRNKSATRKEKISAYLKQRMKRGKR